MTAFTTVLVSGVLFEVVLLANLPGLPVRGIDLIKAYGIVYLLIIAGPVGATMAGPRAFGVSVVLGACGIAVLWMNRQRTKGTDIIAGILWTFAGVVGAFVQAVMTI